ncbi:hypothetical protein SK128_019032 [Halocaridina rubra]|uniref:Uncharacterized protein n=1 Tax=Halocaridina rubra TaxID=373956 RepID=A0AAN8WWN3_HALRR
MNPYFVSCAEFATEQPRAVTSEPSAATHAKPSSEDAYKRGSMRRSSALRMEYATSEKIGEAAKRVGMNKSLVMTEEDRKALMSRKLERKRKLLLEHQRIDKLIQESNFLSQKDPNTNFANTNRDNSIQNHSSQKNAQKELADNRNDSKITEILTHEDKGKILYLQKLLRKALCFPEFPQHYYEQNADIIEHLFFLLCKSMGKFFSFNPEFRNLQARNQKALLKPAVAKAVFILGMHQFEHQGNCWPRRPLTSNCSFPTIDMPAVEKFIDDQETISKWKEFIWKYSALYSDEVIMLLTLMITLFDNNDNVIADKLEIANKKAGYVSLLENYVKQFYSTSSLSTVISQIFASLTDVQKLEECFQNSSTEEKNSSASDSRGSHCFSSSLGTKTSLPPKKALHMRNINSFRAEENQDVLFLGKFKNTFPSDESIKLEKHTFQSDYALKEYHTHRSPNRNLNPVALKPIHDLDHDFQTASNTCLDKELLQTMTQSNMQLDKKLHSQDNRELYPPLLGFQVASVSKNTPNISTNDACQQASTLQDPMSFLTHYNTHTKSQDKGNFPLGITYHQSFMVAPKNSPHGLLSLENIGAKLVTESGASSSKKIYVIDAKNDNGEITTSLPEKGKVQCQLPISYKEQRVEASKLSSEDEELIEALEKSLPPYLAKHLAKKIGKASREHM